MLGDKVTITDTYERFGYNVAVFECESDMARYYVGTRPLKDRPSFTARIPYGASIDDCVAEVEEISSQIKGIQVESFTGSAAKLKANLEQFSKWGLQFK